LLFAASGQLRNMASMGGNIMQRTRAPISATRMIYPATSGGGLRLRGLHGLNRNHAIFGWSDACVATNPSDVAGGALPPWTATVVVRGPRANERSRSPISIACQATRRNVTTCSVEAILSSRSTCRLRGRSAPRTNLRFRPPIHMSSRSSPRRPASQAMAGAPLARLALGGVAHKPWRLTAPKPRYVGHCWPTSTRSGRQSPRLHDARPLADNAFKVELAQRVALRALQTAEHAHECHRTTDVHASTGDSR